MRRHTRKRSEKIVLFFVKGLGYCRGKGNWFIENLMEVIVLILSTVREKFDQARREIRKVFIGEDDLVTCIFIGFLNAGMGNKPHILITGDTGTGKTTIAKVMGIIFGLERRRVQGHPDLSPDRIIGSVNVLVPDRKFNKGPIFTNVLHVDEIPRILGMTRAALLEAMEEGKVTIEEKNRTYDLPKPFIVIATQNPSSYGDSQPLGPQENDRFLLSYFIQWPSEDVRAEIVSLHIAPPKERSVPKKVFGREELFAIAKEVAKVHISQVVVDYVIAITRQLNPELSSTEGVMKGDNSLVKRYPPNRPALDLTTSARALAFLRGDSEVTDKHVDWLVPFALPHRIETVGYQELKHGQIEKLSRGIIVSAKEEMIQP